MTREDQERASATTFQKPGRWTRLLVNSEMKDKLLLLPGGPGQRDPELRVCERLVVCEQGKTPTFQEEREVSHVGVSS